MDIRNNTVNRIHIPFADDSTIAERRQTIVEVKGRYAHMKLQHVTARVLGEDVEYTGSFTQLALAKLVTLHFNLKKT